jgi:hypothetical protein
MCHAFKSILFWKLILQIDVINASSFHVMSCHVMSCPWKRSGSFITIPHLRGWSWIAPTTSGIIYWPIVRALDDRLWWKWGNYLNEWLARETKVPGETCSSAALSITDITLIDLCSNPGLRHEKPTTNCLSLSYQICRCLEKWFGYSSTKMTDE